MTGCVTSRRRRSRCGRVHCSARRAWAAARVRHVPSARTVWTTFRRYAFGRCFLTYPRGVGPEDLLPEQTRDDVDPEDAREVANRDEWLRDQVPPHHG